MTLADIQTIIYRNTLTNSTSYPNATMVIDLNAAAGRVNARIKKFLDNFRPTAWSASDLSTGTAEPKFDADFHELIPLYVSLSRANARKLPGYNGWLERTRDLENQLEDFYGARNYEVFTITIAAPGVITKDNHGLQTNDRVTLTTTGALPTGLSVDTFYYVIYQTAHTFELASTRDGSAITTSGSQSGTHYYASDRARRLIARNDDTR